MKKKNRVDLFRALLLGAAVIVTQEARAESSPDVSEQGVESSPQSVIQTTAQAEVGTTRPQPALLIGEGQTLPHGIFRSRWLHRSVTSDSSFADFGTAKPSGFQLRAQAAAVILEMGITPAVSLQVVVPAVLSNELSLDGAQFTQSQLYNKNEAKFLNGIAENLVESGLCENVSLCMTALTEKNLSLPYDKEIVLPTGETLAIKQGIPLKAYAAPFLVNSIVPAEGRTGLGDVEVGFLMAVADPKVGYIRDWDTGFSLGLGLRLPTGAFTSVPQSQRSTGRGVTDLGVRMNLDRLLSKSVMLSVQHQTELMLLAGEKKRSSLLSSGEFNSADPSVAGADGVANTAVFTRKSPRHIGFFKVAWSAASLAEMLHIFVVNGFLKYDFDSPGELGGLSLGDASAHYSAQVGLSLNGLRVGIPLQLDFDYEMPLAGSNKVVAARVMTTTLKSYFRF